MENKTIDIRKTSLHDHHVSLKAKMVNFADYLMPINYDKGIKFEYNSVRNDVGLFDVSHMGVFKVSGENSEGFLNKVLSNNILEVKNNCAIYTLLCNEIGGIIDDLILYKIDNYFILIVNASNKEKDLSWLKHYSSDSVTIEDESDETSLIAVQGPNSRKKLEEIFQFNLGDLKFYACKKINYADSDIFVARTGYTGELGFEILGNSNIVNKMWETMIDSGIDPSGLAVRDVLRIEMGYCLYGHEIDESRNAIDAGLSWILDKKSDFIGKKTIFDKNKQKEKIIFFKMLERGIPREGCEIFCNDKKAGYVTSGTFSYLLNMGLGIAYMDRAIHEYNNSTVMIRDKKYKIELKQYPFLTDTSLRT